MAACGHLVGQDHAVLSDSLSAVGAGEGGGRFPGSPAAGPAGRHSSGIKAIAHPLEEDLFAFNL